MEYPKIEITYSVGSSDMVWADIKLSIGTDDDFRLPCCYRSNQSLMGEDLSPDWGYRDNGIRYRESTAEAQDWDELNRKIDSYTRLVAATLQEVFDGYQKLSTEQPADYALVIDLENRTSQRWEAR